MKRIGHLFIFAAMLASIGTLLISLQVTVFNMPARMLVIVFGVEVAWCLVAIIVDFITIGIQHILRTKHGKKISEA